MFSIWTWLCSAWISSLFNDCDFNLETQEKKKETKCAFWSSRQEECDQLMRKHKQSDSSKWLCFCKIQNCVLNRKGAVVIISLGFLQCEMCEHMAHGPSNTATQSFTQLNTTAYHETVKRACRATQLRELSYRSAHLKSMDKEQIELCEDLIVCCFYHIHC